MEERHFWEWRKSESRNEGGPSWNQGTEHGTAKRRRKQIIHEANV